MIFLKYLSEKVVKCMYQHSWNDYVTWQFSSPFDLSIKTNTQKYVLSLLTVI